MRTFWIVLSTIVSIIVLGLIAFFLVGFLKPKPGGIYVVTNPVSGVYIDDSLVGKTPFKGMYEAKNISVKLVPEETGSGFIPYETKITLISGIQTVIRREFGKTEEESSGDVISFEKETGNNTSLIVISTPDNAQVSLDGVPRGFTPYKTSTISPAEHQITIKALNFNDRIMTVKTIPDYRLTVFTKLAKSAGDVKSTETTEATPAPAAKSFVEILQTPTGFLRVRTEPGTKGEEIAEVKPGSKYPYLDTDTSTGWFKIQYEEVKPGLPNGITGWVSNQFAKKVDEQSSSTPSATPQ